MIVMASLLALPCPVLGAAGLPGLDAGAVARVIDVTSFPNSIGPRREEGRKTFADYGFTTIDLVEATAELYEDDRAWKFAVTVLDASEDGLLLCIVDMALGGPAYHTQDAVAFQPGEGGLLVATGAKFEASACPHVVE